MPGSESKRKEAKGEGYMKRENGCWHYQGRVYESLHAALAAVWPGREA